MLYIVNYNYVCLLAIFFDIYWCSISDALSTWVVSFEPLWMMDKEIQLCYHVFICLMFSE